MANPQKENGYTPIANEIMDKLAKSPIRSEVRRVIDFILRKTYGFNKKYDTIALSQFEAGTEMKRPNICKALKEALCKRIIIKTENGYVFNKNVDEWVVCKRITVMQMHNLGGMQTHNRGVCKRIHTKVDITKDNITKDTLNVPTPLETKKRKEFQIDSTPYQLASLLFENIRRNNEKIKTPNLQAWADDFEKMLRIDGNTQQEIEAVILWCQNDNFWKNNILSASKLREKFPQLWMKGKAEFEARKNRIVFIS